MRIHCQSFVLFCCSRNFRRQTRLFSTQDARSILDAAIAAVDPVHAVHSFVQPGLQIDGRSYHHYSKDIKVVAFGKASAAMATALTERLPTVVTTKGLVIAKDHHVTPEQTKQLSKYNIVVREASHPVPDQRSVDASRELMDLLKDNTDETLTLCLISGGGSSLFCLPHPELTLEDLIETNQALLQSGLDIKDMNVIRKRLEVGKGGGLAKAAKGTLVSLILSDVLGDPLDLIASGPTVPDTSNFQDAWNIVQRLPPDALPPKIVKFLERGLAESNENDSDDPSQTGVRNILVGNNHLAVEAAAKKAKALGYNPCVIGTQIEGESKEVARVLVAMAAQVSKAGNFAMTQIPAAIIAGGETTVTIPKGCTGKGGRNQELALAAAIVLKDKRLYNVILGSVGTDGTDGPTDAAGAIVDATTIDRLKGDAYQALQNHDAYNYLKTDDSHGEGSLVITGPTGTNVADVCVVLVK